MRRDCQKSGKKPENTGLKLNGLEASLSGGALANMYWALGLSPTMGWRSQVERERQGCSVVDGGNE